jgi:hypothetical protein
VAAGARGILSLLAMLPGLHVEVEPEFFIEFVFDALPEDESA